MSNQNDLYTIKCYFCGFSNEFTLDEIADSSQSALLFREKFCLECGAPLLFPCPKCKTKFRLDHNFKQTYSIEELPSFWNPKEQSIDKIIPEMGEYKRKYKEKAIALTAHEFRANQKKFLENLTPFQQFISEMKHFFENLPVENLSSNKKLSGRLKTKLTEIEGEIQDIFDHIDPEIKLVDLKKEKQIKKHGFHFNELIQVLDEFIDFHKNHRQADINAEIEELRPGLQKLRNHFKVSPDFFRLVCPKCNTNIYSINHQIYVDDSSQKRLIYIETMSANPKPKGISSDLEGVSLTFDVNIDIYKQQHFLFHGELSLALTQKKPYIFGRNVIREVEYTPNTSEDVLFNEDDPLARVSNSQITLTAQKEGILLIPMMYDDRRVGTYYNSFDYDIRIQSPNGIYLKKGDVIIIPLISENEIHNFIKLTFTGLS